MTEASKAETGASEKRHSIFSRFHSKKGEESEVKSIHDGESTLSADTTNSRFPLLSGRRSSKADKPPKEKRPSISDEGPFKVITDPDTGMSYTVENKNWPPGVNYKESYRIKQMQGRLGPFYEGGAIVAGGENAANTGPDPDMIPGLSEEEREKLKKNKKGSYGKYIWTKSFSVLTSWQYFRISGLANALYCYALSVQYSAGMGLPMYCSQLA